MTIAQVGGLPAISIPASLRVYIGSDFALQISERGPDDASYQWTKDGVPMPGKNGPAYYGYNATTEHAGVYRLIVTTPAGSVTSNAAVVTTEVRPPTLFSVTLGPPAAVVLGQAFSFTASLTSGSQPITYQWYKDGQPITGAVDATYTRAVSELSDIGAYSVIATNAAGRSESSSVGLKISFPRAPILLQHPGSKEADITTNALTMTALAAGSEPLTYTWTRDGVPNPPTYFSSGITPADTGEYRVVVSNAYGSVTSEPARLELRPPTPPRITFLTPDRTIEEGRQISLLVAAISSPVATVQWRKDGSDIAGATSTAYEKSNITLADAGVYTAVVTNPNGSVVSDPVTVTVRPGSLPVIISHPPSINTVVPQELTLAVETNSFTPLSYQWYRDGQPIADAVNPSYNVRRTQLTDAGTYTVVVSNAFGAVTSREAVVTVGEAGAWPTLIYTAGSRVFDYGVPAVIKVTTYSQTDAVQWLKDGVPIPGSTSNILSFQAFSREMVGRYRAVVTPVGGASETSPDVFLELRDEGRLPEIVLQPRNAHVSSLQNNSSISLYVEVEGEKPFTYRWQKDGLDITGATFSSYNIGRIREENLGTYTVRVTNRNGVATSVAAVISAGEAAPPVFVQQPFSVAVPTGSQGFVSGVLRDADRATYQWYKDGAPLSLGSTPIVAFMGTTAEAGRYRVVATNPYGSTSSDEVTVAVVPSIELPYFIEQPQGTTLTLGQNVTLSGFAGGPADRGGNQYQWRKDGVPIAGANGPYLTLTNIRAESAGGYSVVVSNANGIISSRVAKLRVNLPPPNPYAGVYRARFSSTVGGPDYWSLCVDEAGKAVFIGILPQNSGVVVIRDIQVLTSGQFRRDGLVGRITNGIFTGTFEDGRVPAFSGPRISGTVSYAGTAGYFTAVLHGTSLGEVEAIVSPDGVMVLAIRDGTGRRGGLGNVNSNGDFRNTIGSHTYYGHLDITGALRGGYQTQGGEVVAQFATPQIGRLFNVATRGVARAGDGLLIAGFVVTGTEAKEVLIRAVGPTLAELDVTEPLANPHLRVVNQRTGETVAQNDDWDQGSELSGLLAASARTGAYPFKPGMKDAALVLRLNPGVYTAQASTGGSRDGVALVEVYDSTVGNPYGSKLVNLSTRGDVGRGDNILILGLNVSGSGPRKLLIRAIGPGLKAQDVPGFLADPKMELYKGQTKLLENDNWGDTTDKLAIASTAGQVGAFELAEGSKDAAMLVYLAPESEAIPGAYTVLVRGVGDTTGIALVELYEVP